MTLLITLLALGSLIPALYAAYGEVEDRLRSQRLTRELGRAFSK